MKIYLENLIQRLINYSYSLDKIELLLDTPWVLIVDDNNYQKYIFKRDGSLIMSSNGIAQIGSWEYLNSAKSILIDRNKDKILLNQFYFDKSVLVLKPDGFNQDYFLLANELLIPDLNIEKYFKTLTKNKFNIVSAELTTGKNINIYLENSDRPKVGMKATLDDKEVEYDRLISKKTNKLYEIRDGVIIRISYPIEYTVKGEKFVIEQSESTKINVGDLMFQNGNPAPNGKYKMSFMNYIDVQNGTIVRKSVL
jgi:hypothetical protein